MGDMGDMWRAVKPQMKEQSKKKKDLNLEYAHKKLQELGIDYLDYGYHFAVISGDKTYDFWPTTGKWCLRNSGNYKRGINGLIKAIQNDT